MWLVVLLLQFHLSHAGLLFSIALSYALVCHGCLFLLFTVIVAATVSTSVECSCGQYLLFLLPVEVLVKSLLSLSLSE